MSQDRPVLFFDGVCNLCDASVRFVLDHERDATLAFVSLQSSTARAMLPPLGVDPGALSSLVLVEDDRAFTKSDAALRLARYLTPPWSFLWWCRWIPRPVRDAVYDVVARHRYAWFGRKDECAVPTPARRARFLDG